MAERSIICQMILDNSIIPSITITEQYFTDYRCRQAFGEIQKQYTLHGGATKDCLIDIGIEYDWVIETINLIPTSANYSFYESKIKTAYKSAFEKRIIQTAKDILKGVTSGDVMQYLEKEITEFSAEIMDYKTQNIQDVLIEGIKDIEMRYHNHGELPGITSGLNQLDAHLMGFQDRQYYIVGSRPSDGKTAIGINFLLAAAKSGKVAGMISAESASKEIGRRIFAREGRIDASKISLGTLTPGDFGGLQDVGERIGKYKILFYDEPNPCIETVERKAREWKRRNGLNILFVDYVQIIQGGKGDNNHERIADVSLRLKGLARGLEIPIVCMAQIGRTGTEKRPCSENIAGSDQITRDADGILLIHHCRNNENKITESEIIIDKARDGKQGVVKVRFETEYLNFRNI